MVLNKQFPKPVHFPNINNTTKKTKQTKHHFFMHLFNLLIPFYFYSSPSNYFHLEKASQTEARLFSKYVKDQCWKKVQFCLGWFVY